jgi:uncharacterized protein YndB with AHSA1/START domain
MNEAVAVPDIDRDAPAVVRHERTFDAPLERVWAVQTDIDRWPSWRSDVDGAELLGTFAVGSSFRWSTGGLDITSTVLAVEPRRLLVWSGPARGIFGIHRWVFESNGHRVHVTTEESWSGEAVQADPTAARSMLDEHLTRWLDELGQAAAGDASPS